MPLDAFSADLNPKPLKPKDEICFKGFGSGMTFLHKRATSNL